MLTFGPLKFELGCFLDFAVLFTLVICYRMVVGVVLASWSSLSQIVKERDIEWQKYVKLLRQRRIAGMMTRWSILAVRRRGRHRSSLHSYSHVCRRMLTYADVC